MHLCAYTCCMYHMVKGLFIRLLACNYLCFWAMYEDNFYLPVAVSLCSLNKTLSKTVPVEVVWSIQLQHMWLFFKLEHFASSKLGMSFSIALLFSSHLQITDWSVALLLFDTSSICKPSTWHQFSKVDVNK